MSYPNLQRRNSRATTRLDRYLFYLFLATIYLALFLNHRSSSSTGRSSATFGRTRGHDESITDIYHRSLKHKKEEDKDHSGKEDYSNYSCEDIYRHPLDTASTCLFATTCNDGEGILLGHFIFCSDQYNEDIDTKISRTLLLWLVCSPLALLLVLLFRILGSTAEEFFSPGLEMLSLRLGLPERFAGVTLLALGNGAPDVASVASAIRNDHKRGYLLALGELTGTCMVLSTVVVGAVAFVSPQPVPCRAALIRDVVMFIITMVLVFVDFHDGSINTAEVRSFVGLYVAYVLIVLSADIYQNRKYVAAHAMLKAFQPQEKDKAANGLENNDQQDNNNTTESTPLVPDGAKYPTTITLTHETSGLKSPPPTLIQRMMRVFSNYNETDDDEDDDNDNNNNSDANDNPTKTDDAKGEEDKASIEAPTTEKQIQLKPNSRPPSHRTNSGWGERDDSGHEPLMVFHPHHGGLVNLLKHMESAESTSTSLHGTGNFHPDDLKQDKETAGQHHNHDPQQYHWLDVRHELQDYFTKFIEAIYCSENYNWVDKLLMTCELPVTLLRMVSFMGFFLLYIIIIVLGTYIAQCQIPLDIQLSIPVPCEGYYCRPLLALSVTLSPWWLCYYLQNQFDVNLLEQSMTTILIIFVAIPVPLGLLVLRFAPRGSIPPRPLAAVPITLIGFVVSATWLDLIADKLVDLLTFFAILCHIPSTIMGLTVLAWGNSSQDLIANITVARKDLSIMAITASFAGPVFNMLVGLGIGFSILNSSEPESTFEVHLDGPLRIGFLFSVLNGVLVIVSGVCFGRGVIPKNYGYVAMLVYLLYVVVSITI